MPKVSINILTKNRVELLKKALFSVDTQSFKDFELIVVNDGSTDETREVLQANKHISMQVITHEVSKGITKSRQEALEKSTGEYVAILDDDDEWIDTDKLAKQVKYLDEHKECVLVGGGRVDKIPNSKFQISNDKQNPRLQSPEAPADGGQAISKQISNEKQNLNVKLRPQEDKEIRRTMLLRNNFFTSTVMFRREVAIRAGGFISPIRDDMNELPDNLTNSLHENSGSFKMSEISNGASDTDDFAEDYDLWLRLGKLGQMYNFPQAFTAYRVPNYNKARFRAFLSKQLRLIKREKNNYPFYNLAFILLKLRLFI